jgi:hypothetical protein
MFGWRAQTSFIPGSEVGAAVYLNMAKNVHHVIAYMVLESLLGISSRAWESIAEEQSKIAAERLTRAMLQAFPCSAGEAATRPLADYQGCYRHPAAGVVEVVADGSHLLLKFMDGRLWDMTLKHFGGDVFEAEFARPEVRDYLPVPAHVRFVVEGDRVIALEEPSTRFERQD